MPSQAVFESKDNAVYTTSTGAPVSKPYAAQRIGHFGPLLLQDFHHLDLLAHFGRERIPERVVHAKGAGAHGYFEVTHDITDLTCAALFDGIRKKAPVTVRFSTVVGEAGSSDSSREPRGMSIKIKTEEGNLDWVFNHTPVFFIRDPAKFPAFVHSQKRDPQTHLKDADMFWDFLSQNPESIHQVMILCTDHGTPAGYHRSNAYSAHAFKFVNSQGQFVYVKIHLINDDGCKTLTAAEAARQDPDFGIKDLFEDIEAGKYPSYTVSIQTMTSEEAENFRYNILDATKIWPHAEYPLRLVGKIVLNKNPENYFAEVEQAAFSPSHLVPGIEPSADPLLQGRLFAYPDAQRYRLGVNYGQLAVNAPVAPVAPIANFQRDGLMSVNNQGCRPAYQSSILPLQYKAKAYEHVEHEVFLGAALADLSEVTELDFEQPRALWAKVLNDEDRASLTSGNRQSLS